MKEKQIEKLVNVIGYVIHLAIKFLAILAFVPLTLFSVLWNIGLAAGKFVDYMKIDFKNAIVPAVKDIWKLSYDWK